MNKTIYIVDTTVWNKAKELAKARQIGMGQLIIEALRLFVEPRLR